MRRQKLNLGEELTSSKRFYFYQNQSAPGEINLLAPFDIEGER